MKTRCQGGRRRLRKHANENSKKKQFGGSPISYLRKVKSGSPISVFFTPGSPQGTFLNCSDSEQTRALTCSQASPTLTGAAAPRARLVIGGRLLAPVQPSLESSRHCRPSHLSPVSQMEQESLHHPLQASGCYSQLQVQAARPALLLAPLSRQRTPRQWSRQPMLPVRRPE